MSKSPGQRTVLPLSFSPSNPDAVTVLRALKAQQIGPGQRSATILAWAAAYLNGQTNDTPAIVPELGMTEAELDALLDDF